MNDLLSSEIAQELYKIGEWIAQNFTHTDYMLLLLLLVFADRILAFGIGLIIFTLAMSGLLLMFGPLTDWPGIIAALLSFAGGGIMILLAYWITPQQWKEDDKS